MQRELMMMAVRVGVAACIMATAMIGVAGGQAPEPARPGYLEPYVDVDFGATVTRVTGDPGTEIPGIDGVWDEVARHHYSKDGAWNCDQSLLFLARHHGFPSALFLDGTTYAPVFGRNRFPGTEGRWHPQRPDVMVVVRDDELGLWNVSADTVTVIATFPGYDDLHIGPWEGNLSRDGRWIVLQGTRGEDAVAFAYDLVRGQKHRDLACDGIEVDWVSISAAGGYIVLNGNLDGDNGDQTQVFDLEGKPVSEPWLEYGRPSHYDLTVDDDGEEVAVGVSKSEPDNGRVIKRRLRDGVVTVLTEGGYASHTSARNVARPGWVYVTYQHRGPTWPPYHDEVVAVRLDGGGVQRIAKLHALRVDYLSESQAVPSPDGMRVLFASNWGAASGRPLSAFVAHLPGYTEPGHKEPEE